MNLSSAFSEKRRNCWVSLLKLSSLIVAVCMVASLLQPVRAGAVGLIGMAIVNASSLNIRTSASTSARVLTILKKGNIVKVLSTRGEWSNVTTSGGKVGWCMSRYLTRISSAGIIKPVDPAKLDFPSGFINMAQPFTYQRCIQDMNEISAAYGDAARIVTIGTSVMGNPINAIVIGNPDAQIRIMIQAAMHARESLTALLALRQVECILKASSTDASYKGVKVADLLKNVEVWVVPEANPDGVRLAFEGLAAVPASMPEMASSLKSMNGGSTSFIRWKANARGVDLNRNFAGGWFIEPSYNKPGPINYAGPAPFSEPESIALRDLTLAKDFALTMSYHSSGKVLYWYNPKGGNDLNLQIANQIKSLTGYAVLSVTSHSPGGGYKDWYVENFMRPGLTMEMGSGYTPLPQSLFGTYWLEARFVMLELMWIAAPKSLGSFAN